MNTDMKKNSLFLSLAVVLGVVGGCDVGDKSQEIPVVTPVKVDLSQKPAEAGIDAAVDMTPEQQAIALAAQRPFVVRADAFALLPVERSFDRQQTALRLLSEGGGPVNMFVVPEPVESITAIVEPLPNWRLSGVVIGDGVAALLDMGNSVVDIRPGMKVPDTDWTVVSIDAERAVLRRDNGKLPRYFVVPLSSANEMGGAGNPGGGGGGNRNSGGGGKSSGGGGTRPDDDQ